MYCADMEPLEILGTSFVLGAGAGFAIWFERQGEDISILMLKRWLNRDNLELVTHSRCWLRKGPYTWRTSRAQRTFRITVRDSSGQIRSGWACCGGYFLGVFADAVTFIWDQA